MDSCVLLDLLASFSEQKGDVSITVLHFDHGLQMQSSQWLDFCAGLANQYGFQFKSSNKGIEVNKSIGIEASARRARYQWFEDIIQQSFNKNGSLKNAILMTAHHCDDQAETMLINILRGTGLKGLRGIAEKKVIQLDAQKKHITLRPLLSFTQAELHEYAVEKSLGWVEDLSNQDVKFRRNAIRQNILPELKKIKPDAVQQFTKLSRRVTDGQNLLQELAINDLSLTQQYDFNSLDASYGLGLEGLRVHSVARQLNAIRFWLDFIRYPAESEMDLLQVLDWSLNGANSGAELRRGKRCYRYYQDTLYVMPFQDETESNQQQKNEYWEDSSQPLQFNSFTTQGLKFELCCDENSANFGKSLRVLSLENIQEILLPNGEGHIRAKKCFQSAGVPPWRRTQALFITSKDDYFIEVVGGVKPHDFFIRNSSLFIGE